MNDEMQEKKYAPLKESRNNDTDRTNDLNAPPTDPTPPDAPGRHEEAPGRNPAPSSPTVDESGDRGGDPEGENPAGEG